ncbi:MAG: FAD binding domain-containing protein, partial [Dehalococcoidia bacterium]|nr:FAD binding domain-containing protein [Dehalococcoidia bacterium]
MQRFEYLRANTVEEAVSFLALYKGVAKLLAGGTDLIPGIKNEILAPQCLVDVKAIPDLDAIRCDGEGLRLGAL